MNYEGSAKGIPGEKIIMSRAELLLLSFCGGYPEFVAISILSKKKKSHYINKCFERYGRWPHYCFHFAFK